jgi:probable nitrogen fixation protein
VQTQQANGSHVTPETDPFLKTLIGLIRAEDSYGAWDKKSDAELLSPFVVTKEARRAIPIIGDPDPDVMHRVEQFYRAVALRIEQRTTLMATPTVTLNHEGFGRVFLTVSKLVAFSKTLRDVHRFGFDSLADLSAEGEKAVDKSVKTIDEYPQVARA